MVDYFFPGRCGGGVPQGVLGLVRGTASSTHWDIVTTDHDQGDSAPYPTESRWGSAPWGRVHYLGKRERRPFSRWALIQSLEPDVVVFTSTFSTATVGSLAVRRLIGPGQPVVIWSQGELGPEALNQKRIKKLLYRRLARWVRLFRQVWWFAVDEAELPAANALSSTGPAEHHGYAVFEPPAPGPLRTKVPGSLHLVYAGRIVERKGLLLLLDALRTVTGEVQLDVIGPPEDAGYERRCRERAEALPLNCRVHFLGPLPHGEVMAKLTSAHGAPLLSEFESFGFAVYEAMAVGCVPLISSGTAFEFAQDRGGLMVDRDQDAVHAAVQRLIDMDEVAFRERSEACRTLAFDQWRNDVHGEVLAERLRTLASSATRSTTSDSAGPTTSIE